MTTSSKTTSLHVLLVGAVEHADELENWQGRDVHFQHVESLPLALQHLRDFPVDLIVCEPSLLTSREIGPPPSESALLLSMIGEGVCICDPRGAVLWSNARFQQEPPSVRERALQCSVETARQFVDVGMAPTRLRERRCYYRATNDLHYEISTAPITDVHGHVSQVAVVVHDLTQASRVQEKLEAIDQAGRELLSLDGEQFSCLDPQERLSLIEQRMVRYIQELLHFDNFEIRILDPQTNKLELILSSGVPADAGNVQLFAEAEHSGISGYVAAKGRSYLCPDVTRDPRYLPGIPGARSSLTIPLMLHDRVIGVANFESTRLAAFNEDDRQFAEMFGRYISLALHLLDLLASERRTVTTRIGKNVLADVTGPLNDAMTELDNLLEDYIGHDDLRHRLRSISERVQAVREGLEQMLGSKAGVLAARISGPRVHDPVLAGKRVLLADDEDMIRDTVRNVLSGYGCEVVAVADGQAAVERISNEPFDLVVSDIKMPHKSGYEVFAATKEANPKTPVILTTGFGYDPNHCIIRARREGLAAVLFKPFKVDQLLSEVRTALKAAQSKS